MTVQKKFKTKQKLLDVINYFKELLFYNTCIEKPKNIKDFFNDLLDETKGFKYQITVKILLKKCRGTEIEFSPVYFNSTTKTVINHKFDYDKSFQQILYSIERWVHKGSGWIIESIDFQYINFWTFRPSSGGSKIKIKFKITWYIKKF